MSDFDNAMKKITDVLYSAARKSGEILENTKISYNISSEKDKISKLQAQIGAKLYKMYQDGESIPASILPDIESIKALEIKIADMEKNVSENKATKFCLECGAKLGLECVYCPKCGCKQAANKDCAESTPNTETSQVDPENQD